MPCETLLLPDLGDFCEPPKTGKRKLMKIKIILEQRLKAQGRRCRKEIFCFKLNEIKDSDKNGITEGRGIAPPSAALVFYL